MFWWYFMFSCYKFSKFKLNCHVPNCPGVVLYQIWRYHRIVKISGTFVWQGVCVLLRLLWAAAAQSPNCHAPNCPRVLVFKNIGSCLGNSFSSNFSQSKVCQPESNNWGHCVAKPVEQNETVRLYHQHFQGWARRPGGFGWGPPGDHGCNHLELWHQLQWHPHCNVALQAGKLGGAGLDVMTPEPLSKDHPLAASNNVVLTPHIGRSRQTNIR